MYTPKERIWVLLAKKKSGEASAEELAELATLLASENISGFSNEIVDKIWDAPVFTIPETELGTEVWSRVREKTTKYQPGFVLQGITTRQWLVAASIILIAGCAFLAIYYSLVAGPGPQSGAAHPNLNQVATQPGSKSRLELPDGTQVWLNGNSKLTYSNGSFAKENREVTLTGEAFFDVVKNERIPFIIHTGPVNITVKGTAFNVKAYPKQKTVEASLVRGLIEITTRQDPERRIILKPNEKIIIPVDEPLAAGGSAVRSSGEALYSITKWNSSAAAAPAEIAWMNPQLVFDDEPFEAVAPRMEKWFHIKIVFGDEELKNKRFSGVIEKETLKETLEAMQLSYHFEYQIIGNQLSVGKK